MKNFKSIISVFTALNLAMSQVVFAKVEKKSAEFEAMQNASQMLAQSKKAISFWLQVRSSFSKENQTFLDSWFLANANMELPEMKVVSVTQADGAEGFRLILNFKEKPISVEIKGVDKNIYQINQTKFSAQDFKSLEVLSNKISENLKNKVFKLSDSINELDLEIYSKMNKDDQAMYFINKRLLLESASQVINKNIKSTVYKPVNKMQIFSMLFEGCAQAESSDQCLTSTGFMGLLSAGNCQKNSESSQGPDLFSSLKCSAGTSLCNPMLYGLDRSNSNQGLCVADSADASACAQKSPIKTQEDIAAFKKSLQNFKPSRPSAPQDGAGFPGGGMPPGERPSGFPPNGDKMSVGNIVEKMMKDQNEYIKKALGICENNQKEDAQCKELKERQVRFNTVLNENASVDSDKAQVRTKSNSRTVADSNFDSVSPSRKSSKQDTSCEILCTIGKWISSPTGIVTTTVLASWLSYRAGYLSSYRKNKASSASSTSSTTTVLSPYAVAPTTPTSPDYTGGAQ